MKPPKNDPPWLIITTDFYSRILFYYKNGDVCKKLDLNILKIDWDIAILSLNLFFWNFSKIFEKYFRWGKFVWLGQFLGYPQKIFPTWSLMNPFNYKFVNNGSISPKRGPNSLKIASGPPPPMSIRWSETPWVIGLTGRLKIKILFSVFRSSKEIEENLQRDFDTQNTVPTSPPFRLSQKPGFKGFLSVPTSPEQN